MHVWMHAFTTFNAKIYPIQHAQELKRPMNYISYFQEDGIQQFSFDATAWERKRFAAYTREVAMPAAYT
jgi:hypothetical protein